MDFAILRQFSHPGAFQWNVRLSNKEVGDAVGLDEETVRQRVRRMQERGILQRWSVAVHPALLGRRMMRVELPALAGPSRVKAFEALASMGNVYHLFDFYGGRLAFVLYGENEPAWGRQVALIASLWGAPTSVSEMPMPPPTIEPTATEWKVIAALRRDARAPYALVAERAGLSERTVRRAVDRLVEGRAMWLSAIMEMERAENMLSVAVRVFFDDPSQREPVDAKLGALDGIVFAAHYPSLSQVSYGARRLAEVEELRHDLSGRPGVARVETDIMLRRVTVDGWMDEAIARKVRESTDA